MERMKLEQLARLVDETPTPEEQNILDGDPGLRRELEALKAQSWSLRNLPALLPPPGGWHQLERALSSAGLIHVQSRAAVWRKWLQAAAALVIFVGGTAMGWVTARGPGSPAGGDYSVTAATFPRPASLDEATSLVYQKEWEFRQALMEQQRLLQAQPGAQAGQSPTTRLPYIETILAAAHLAAEAHPGDPFANSFLVRALEEREQVLRQVSQDNWN